MGRKKLLACVVSTCTIMHLAFGELIGKREAERSVL